MGASWPPHGGPLSRYLLDSTVLIAHVRDPETIQAHLLGLIRDGHTLGTTCVNVAEVERGLRPAERRSAAALLDRLGFMVTSREAAVRAGRYQAEQAKRGRTIHIADALVAGTARAHGAIILTHNVDDFPMHDVRVQAAPPIPPRPRIRVIHPDIT